MHYQVIRNTMRVVAAALVVVAAFSATAVADVDTGFYIGGSVGQSFVENDFRGLDDDDDFDFDEDDIAYRFFAGIRPVPFFAVEGGWRDFGTPDDSIADIGRVEADITAWDLFGVLILPIGPVDLFGKAGVGFWDTEFKLGGREVGETGEDFMWGGGVALRLSRFGIRAEWEQLETDFPDSLGVLSLGATVMF